MGQLKLAFFEMRMNKIGNPLIESSFANVKKEITDIMHRFGSVAEDKEFPLPVWVWKYILLSWGYFNELEKFEE